MFVSTGTMQANQDKDTSTDKVQSTREYKKKYRWKRDFPHPSRPALGPAQPPIQRAPGLFPRIKRQGRGVNHPPHLALRLKKE